MTNRVWRHGLGITAMTALIVFATIRPFLPGRDDALAAPISVMCRLLATIGLVLLAPLGALWIASMRSKLLAGRSFVFAMGALIASSLVWSIAVVAVALLSSGVSLALAGAGVWICIVAGLRPRLRLLRRAPLGTTSAPAFYLLIVPVAALALQRVWLPPAIDSSRERAIRNAGPLIADIERYRAAHGRYPDSLFSEWPDSYRPGVIGIAEYRYERHEDAFNLVFEQPALHFGTREFVVYNPQDRQVMTAHKRDILELTPAQLALERTRGHYAVHDAGPPHWKYFWFD